MTRLLFLPNDETVLLLQSSLSTDELVRAVLEGEWTPPLGYHTPQRQAFRAVRLGSSVIIAPREPLSAAGEGDGMSPRFSPRQIEVLQGLVEGLTDKEIATRLGLSAHTVTNHIGILKARLGARTRAESIGRAMALGLVKMKKRGAGS